METVDFRHLRSLLDEIGESVTQQHLQGWLIQSQFTLLKVFNMVLWKLHEDILYRLTVPKVPQGPRQPPCEWKDDEVLNEDVQAVDDHDDRHPL